MYSFSILFLIITVHHVTCENASTSIPPDTSAEMPLDHLIEVHTGSELNNVKTSPVGGNTEEIVSIIPIYTESSEEITEHQPSTLIPKKPETPVPNTTVDTPFMSVPLLPRSYRIGIEVTDIHNGEIFHVEQDEVNGKGKHLLMTNRMNMTCYFDGRTTEGFLVEGVKCSKIGNLPQKCFCGEKFCRPYVNIESLLRYLRLHGAKFRKQSLPGEGNIELWKWSVVKDQMTIGATYSLIRGHASAIPNTDSYLHKRLQPLAFTVKGPGRDFTLPGGPIWLQYKVYSWSNEDFVHDDILSTPAGVFCSSNERKFIPKLSNQFSLTMETIIENLGTIAYEKQSYEAEQKLVSFTYHPHLHADGMFLLNLPGVSDLSVESYRVVHNFRTGIQYMINESTKNCSIQAIPLSALDAAPTENQHVRMRHASELIFIDPHKFLYKGVRKVRGIMCDVWVAERGIRKGRYSTVEVYFSHENWTVEVEVFNKVRQVPLGITSYVADASNPTNWTSIVHTYFYEYRDGHPSWDEFDISPCLSRINRMFLVLTLEVSYSELVPYNLDLAKGSIRKAIAGIGGVSTLRVTDIFLASQPATGEVDVWFVLLEKPDITGPVLTPRPQLPMTDAFELIHDITQNHNVSVKLDLSPSKKLFVTIKRGSLKNSNKALHPYSHQNSLHLMRAGYTAGSVAGLGFSMAILGTCVGIFIGFLLWKRNPNIPYHIRI